MMRDLRTTIHDARAKLNVVLSNRFDAQDGLDLDSLEVDLLMRPIQSAEDVERIIYDLFEDKGLLEEPGLHQIERDCFDKCIELLRAGELEIVAGDAKRRDGSRHLKS
jgi:hypothetical protein